MASKLLKTMKLKNNVSGFRGAIVLSNNQDICPDNGPQRVSFEECFRRKPLKKQNLALLSHPDSFVSFEVVFLGTFLPQF